jgi:hypothetical protein
MKLLPILFCLLFTNLISAQFYGLDWAFVVKDTISHRGIVKVLEQKSDAQGNIYVTGSFKFSADMDPTNGSAIIVANSDQYNIFLAKYDSQGDIIWAKDFGGSSSQEIKGMDVDNSGNIFLTGYTKFSLYYDPAVHDAHINSVFNGYWTNTGFIMKFNLNGGFEWITRMETNSSLYPDDVEVNPLGNIFVTGRFKNEAYFSNSLKSDTLVSNGLYDVFIARYSPNGNYEWAISIGGSGDDNGLRLTSDSAGNVYLLADLSDTVDLDPSINIYEVNRVGSFSSVHGANTIAKYDSLGNFKWGHLYQDILSGGYVRIRDIDVNSLGQIGITGQFYDPFGLIDFDLGLGTANIATSLTKSFVALYDSSSTFLWAEDFGQSQYGALELAFTSADKIFIVGSINDVYNSQHDGFLTKCGANGGVLYTKLLDAEDEVHNINVSINQLDEPVISAQISNSIDLDPSAGTYNITGHSFLAYYTTSGDIQYGFSLNDFEYYPNVNNGRLDDYASYIETDNNGNIFARGNIGLPSDFDMSSGSEILGESSSGKSFVVKYDSMANYVWGFTLDSITRDGRLAVDPQGNCYISATSTGTTDLDPSSGTAIYSSQNTNGLVAKYDNLGNIVWHFGLQAASSNAKSSVQDILIDSVGNVLICGYYIGSVDFDPSSAQFIQSTSGMQEQKTFIAKYDANGNFIWAVGIGRLHSDAVDLAVNSNNDIFITGSFYGPIDIDPSAGTYNVSGGGNRLILLAKYDSLANLQWGFALGDSGTNWGTTVVAGRNHVYLSGAFSSTCDMDPGPGITNLTSNYNASTFLARFDVMDGSLDWAFDLTEAWSEPRGMDINSNENIVLSGVFNNLWSSALEEPKAMDVDPSANTLELLAITQPIDINFGIYTCVYDSLGELQWAMDIPASTKYFNYENRGGIARYDKSNNIIVSGALLFDGDFAPREAEYVLETKNGSEFFIAKYRECMSTYSTKIDTACGNYDWQGNNYTISGIYFDTISNHVGCDSVLSITLTILPIDTMLESVIACDSFTWTNGINYTSSGTYYNYLTNSSGCDSTLTLNLTIQNVDKTITVLNDSTLFANEIGANYQWFDCQTSQVLTGEVNQSYNTQTSGSYAVILESGICKDTSACYIINMTNNIDEFLLSEISVYPNPASNGLTIELEEEFNTINVQFLDANGRTLFNNVYLQTSVINLNFDYASGIYLLIINSEGNRIQRTIVIKN